METLRLRQVQRPSRVQMLLDAFASSADILPEGCYQIRDRSTLPAVLQRIDKAACSLCIVGFAIVTWCTLPLGFT